MNDSGDQSVGIDGEPFRGLVVRVDFDVVKLCTFLKERNPCPLGVRTKPGAVQLWYLGGRHAYISKAARYIAILM